jgi:hypothetical protein
MDIDQTKVIELLREVHLIAFKEIERLNMRIVLNLILGVFLFWECRRSKK